MALVLKDRVKESSTITGTGTVTLLGAQTGFQSFNTAVPTGSIVYYCIALQGGDEWEVGYGTFTAPDQLSRDSIYSSSAAGAAVNFTAGTKDVFITYPAEQAVFQETNGDLRIIDGVIEVSLDGTQSNVALPNVSFQAFSTIDSYMQANQQNFSSGNSASADYVVTADNGTDEENYIDLGMGSSGYNYPEFSGSKANDGYLINTGNNLVFMSGKYGANSSNLSNTTDIVFVAGSLLDTEERMRIKSSTGNVILSSSANPTDNGQKLQVVGDADISSNATVGGTIVIEGAAYSNAANITALNQLATKAYVDNATAAGLHIHEPVLVATTGNLVAVYDQPNGASNGIGATLTNNATQETIVIDNVTLSANNRVLVYQQSNAVQNGVYIVTSPGNATTNWVLTRSSDTDTSSQNDPNSLGGGDYFYVQDGDTQAGDSYVCTSEGNITFGTTLITFSQFSAAPEYVGTAPINVSGQTISLTGVVDVAHGGTNIASYTAGDVIYASASTTLNKLPLGSSGQTLIVSGSAPAWGALDMAGAGVSGVLPETHGGTNQSSYVTGDTLYASGANTLGKLAPNTTTTRKFMGQTGTGTAGQAPVWVQPAASDITGLAPSATTDTSNASNITSGTLPSGRLTGSYTGVTGVGTISAGAWAANTIAVSYGGTGATNATDARTNLGLVIGTNVQAYSATLQTVANLSSNGILGRTAANTITATALTTNYIPYGNGTGSFAQSSGLQFDGSNLGLGVAPSAWRTDRKVMQFGLGGSLAGSTTSGSYAEFNCNTYQDTSNNYVYLTTGVANAYRQVAGEHRFYNAASGTAGNAITFTQAMTLDASGNLLVGRTSSDGYKVATYGLTQLTSGYQLTYGGVAAASMTVTSGGALAFGLDGSTGGTERFRIGSAGQLGIGGANYGTSGQALVSNGSGSAPSWQTVSSNKTTFGLYENSATISADYTITSGNNAMSAGPITVNSGVTVTVPSGSTWTVV